MLLFKGKHAYSNEIQPLKQCLRQRPDFIYAFLRTLQQVQSPGVNSNGTITEQLAK